MALATHDGAAPYTSLMAFAASAELDRLFFVTSRATHKYSNMAANNQVSALIDPQILVEIEVDAVIA